MDNKTVISLFVEEVINQGRLERANDLVAEDFVELNPLPGQKQSREEKRRSERDHRGHPHCVPDIQWVLDEMIAEDNKVASRFTWTGTHRSSFLGI